MKKGWYLAQQLDRRLVVIFHDGGDDYPIQVAGDEDFYSEKEMDQLGLSIVCGLDLDKIARGAAKELIK